MLVDVAPERPDTEPDFRIKSEYDYTRRIYTKFVAHIGDKIISEFNLTNCKKEIKKFPRYALCHDCNKAIRKSKSIQAVARGKKTPIILCKECYELPYYRPYVPPYQPTEQTSNKNKGVQDNA